MAPCLSNDTSFFVYYLQLHRLRHSISPLRSVESTSIVGKCNSIRLTKSITTVPEYNRYRLIHFSGPKCPWQQALCEFSWPKIPHSPGIDYRKSREVHRASKKALQALIRDRYVCYQAADVRIIPQPLTGDLDSSWRRDRYSTMQGRCAFYARETRKPPLRPQWGANSASTFRAQNGTENLSVKARRASFLLTLAVAVLSDRIAPSCI
jgi:hypothetical protein